MSTIPFATSQESFEQAERWERFVQNRLALGDFACAEKGRKLRDHYLEQAANQEKKENP